MKKKTNNPTKTPLLVNVEARFTLENGIEISALFAGRRFRIEDLKDLADEIGNKPNESLEIAFGYKAPDTLSLLESKVLNYGGNHRAAIGAETGENCKQFCEEVYNEKRWELLKNEIKNMGMNQLWDGMIIKEK